MPRPRPLPSGFDARRTLAHRLTGRADRLRQLATRFGVRPYRVFLVHTRWSGDKPGDGEESVVRRVEIVPTPRVSDVTAESHRPWSGGFLPEGSLRVDRISAGAYTLDALLGRRYAEEPQASGGPSRAAPVNGDGLDPRKSRDVDFFWEVVEDGRGDEPAERQRFRVVGRPWRHAGGLEFVVLLEPQSGGLDRDGQSNDGLDVGVKEQIES